MDTFNPYSEWLELDPTTTQPNYYELFGLDPFEGDEKKITAADGVSNDLFGFSVAVSGDAAIVGAPHESPGIFHAGAAYVFPIEPVLQ